MDVTVVQLYHIGPELIVHLVHVHVPVSGQKTGGEEQSGCYTPRQQAVPGVCKTVEQRYVGKYKANAKQQIAQTVVYQSGQPAETGNHRLEHRQVESYVIEQIIIDIIYVKQRHAYICKQYDHSDGLVVEHQHKCGGQTHYEHQRGNAK